MEHLVVHSLGGDRHRITVRGHELVVDQPLGAGGEDAAPTPTELFVASLASCIGHYARRALGSSSPGATIHCAWELSTGRPWRVTAIDIRVDLPADTPAARRAAVERAVSHCTVHNSITDPPLISVGVSEPGSAAHPTAA